MKKKWLAVGIILLFIGVAVTPCINFIVVKASNDNDFVEVTTQTYGVKGFEDTTVKLTREQYQDLKQYLVDFRARLNQTTTKEEAIPIFKEAVVELDKYGLLPKGMSVEHAQRLVVGQYQNQRQIMLLERPFNKNDYIINSNLCCLIAGETTNTTLFGPFAVISEYGFTLLSNLLYILGDLLYSLGMPLGDNFWSLVEYLFWIGDDIPPFEVFGILAFGYHWFEFPPMKENINKVLSDGIKLSEGWVYTIGILGIKKWEGAFYGGLFALFCPFALPKIPFAGAIGFTGLRVGSSLSGPLSFLGSAFFIKIHA